MRIPTLDIAGLSVDYGPTRALDKVSLQATAGEILGILGPNGSGKTTLLRSITGKLRPATGHIYIQGHPLRVGKAYQHSIAFAPQSLGLYKHLTTRENLEVFGRFVGLSSRDLRQRIAQVLGDIQLSDKADVLASRLSGGMLRRLHIAVTLLARPALLVLDEPTAGVDLAARAAIHALIRKRAAQGTAIVLVTHELEEAETLCHALGILHNGRLFELAAPHQLVTNVFGNAQVFSVRTEYEPGPQCQNHFKQIGLHPGPDKREWHMWAEMPLEIFVRQLNQDPDVNSPTFREVSMRRPDLNDVMRHVTNTHLPTTASDSPKASITQWESAVD